MGNGNSNSIRNPCNIQSVEVCNIQSVEVDLSKASDTGLRLIFCHVPPKTLVRVFRLVSKQWHTILANRRFWLEKMTYDGYIFPPQLVSKFGDAGVDLAKVAVLRPFNRNFIKDKWSEDGRECHFDRRWDGLLFKILAYLPAFNKNQDSIILKAVSDSSLEWNSTAVPFVIESPPLFLQDYGVPQPNIFGCLVSGSINWDSYKTIIISLEDEGLTAEVLKLRPTIRVSEMFAFRADSSALYEFECVFSDRFPKFRWPYYFDDTGEIREEYPDGARFVKRVKQWKAQQWREISFEFREYPLTARYLKIRSGGSNMHFWRGKYGPKMISCSVTAYADTNASKEEEIIPMCEYLMLILLRWIFCKGPVTISLERWIKNSLHHISPPAR